MTCPICKAEMKLAFTAKVLGKYDGNYEFCEGCGYLRVNDPFWLPEAYADAIAQADTGIIIRNISISSKLAGILHWVMRFPKGAHFLDSAGGYGLLTRLMRDIGFDFYWHDIYCQNLIAPGFESPSGRKSYAAITAMEVMEHVVDPIEFVERALSESGAKNFIFSTEIFEGQPPKPDDWWYYVFETGQHIGFFQKRTLETIAKKLNLHFSSSGGIHIFSEKPINRILLRLVSNKLIAPFSMLLVRKLTGSKTMSDHHMMLNNINR
jgi:hypothetical protein